MAPCPQKSPPPSLLFPNTDALEGEGDRDIVLGVGDAAITVSDLASLDVRSVLYLLPDLLPCSLSSSAPHTIAIPFIRLPL